MAGLVLLKPNLQLDFGLLNTQISVSHCSWRSKHANRGRLLDRHFGMGQKRIIFFVSFYGRPNEILHDRVTFIVLELPPSMPNRRWGAKPPTVLKNTLDYPSLHEPNYV